jgi:hypothetical protein
MRPIISTFLAACLTIAAGKSIAQTSSGTGFAVAPGLLITNNHVIAGCGSIEIISADGRRTGTVVDADDQIDLALLRAAGIKGATARLRNPRNVRLGEPVMVFGFPLVGALTSSGNFTSGLVSGLRGLRDAAGEIQITAPVQPGNSGGPVLDASGLVVGVVQAKLDALRSALTTGDIPQNVNFAISLEVLADFLTKNNVSFRNGAPSTLLDTARIAALAQSFTHRVECRRRSQRATFTPESEQRRPSPVISNSKAARDPVPPAVTPEVVYIPPPAIQRPCIGSFNAVAGAWTNCFGEVTFPPYNSKYVGEWKDNKRHGQGKLTYPDGREYVGEFKDNDFNGRGTLTYSGGRKYVGGFQNGKFNGHGTLIYPDGGKWIGEFRDGRRNGKGIAYRPEGTVLQEGIWENDVFVEQQ